MGRVEENNKVIKHFMDEYANHPDGTFDELVVWQLGAISSFLADISKSLAVIADQHINGEEQTGEVKDG